MTEYRIHDVLLPEGTTDIAIGLIVGKSDRVREVPLTRPEAWRLARRLIAALSVTEHEA
jgi:hypothetical protein